MKMQDAMQHIHNGAAKVQAVGQATVSGVKTGGELLLGLVVLLIVGGFLLIPLGHHVFGYWGEVAKAWTSPAKPAVARR